jgi:peptidoglycan hydrolase-like protein with peptidoglycan-binding domain
MRRRHLVLAAVAICAALLIVLSAANPFGSGGTPSAHAVPVAWARVVRTNVVERQQVTGTLDYSGSFTVSNTGGTGVVTWLPAAGSVVHRGQPLYALGRSAVRLLYGSRPASRDLTLGSFGADVRELQQNLRTLGFSAGGALQLDGSFDIATLAAVEQWQRALGEPVTGTIPLGSVAYLPGAVRISGLTAAEGAPVQAGAPILSATSATPAVLVPLDPGSVLQLSIGDPVLVTMPDSTTVRGRVASVGRVATASSPDNGQGGQGGGGTATVPVTVTLVGTRTGGLDQAPVQVAITEQQDRHVLAVPISALLAQPGGGYAVTVAGSPTSTTIPVTTGLFDDVAGRVEVSGSGLVAGLRVEVPSQ